MTKIIAQLRKKYNKRTVNILGTEYLIRFENTETVPALNDLCGYCSYNSHEIVINQEVNYFKDKSDEWITNDIKATLRHELIHAFFGESGLTQSSAMYNGAWAQNEEMVDWMSLQSPKIFKVFTELELIEKEKNNVVQSKRH